MGCIATGTFDTKHVIKSERIDYWEASCSADLIGLRCSTTEEDGFQAKFDYYDFGSFTVYDITGQPHVICRSSEMVRKSQKDSVFLTLIMGGEAFVSRRQHCNLLKAGDLVLYDTNTPYMHGFADQARQVVFDVPGEDFRLRFPGWDLKDAVHISGGSGAGETIARAVRKTFSDVRARKYLTPEPDLVHDIWSALELSHDLLFSGVDLNSYHMGIIQRVRGHVRANLDDPALDTESVARHIGMSSRQLNRILTAHRLTVKKLILNERLERARRVIESAGSSRTNLSELAYKCGFSGPSQFSKSFRRHFGRAPSEVRDMHDNPH